MSLDLSKRKILAEFIKNSQLPAGLEVERLDLLEILKQWQTGTLHGIAKYSPPIDPQRNIEHSTLNIEPQNNNHALPSLPSTFDV